MSGPLITRPFLSIALIVCVLALGACSPKVAQRGDMPDIDAIASIVPEESHKSDVERRLGSPSSINMFGEETWMYIGETTEAVAFFEPKVNERSVLVVTFDDKGIVKDIQSHRLDVARDIEPVERTTPTVGKNLTVIEQLMGNLNRFGKIGQNN